MDKNLEEALDEAGLEVRFSGGCDECDSSTIPYYAHECKFTALCHKEFGDGAYVRVKPSADFDDANEKFNTIMSKRMADLDSLNTVHE